jgi:hypothetical protein
MKSRDAILMARLGKPNRQPTVKAGGYEGAKSVDPAFASPAVSATQGSLPQATAKTMGSLDVLKATRASSSPRLKAKAMGAMPQATANLDDEALERSPDNEKLEGDVFLGPTEVKGYSPIRDYLKKKGR